MSEILNPAAWAANEEQKSVQNAEVSSDGSQVAPIKCTVSYNIDLCQTFETAEGHSEQVLCKIRSPDQAPVQLICQFKGQVTEAVTKAFSQQAAASTSVSSSAASSSQTQGGVEE